MALHKGVCFGAGLPLISRVLRNGSPVVSKGKVAASVKNATSGGRHPLLQTRRSCQTISTKELAYPLVLENRDLERLVTMYDTFLVDCDGVLWGNDHFTKWDNISRSVERLRAHGKQLIFVTNNSMHTREVYLDKFKKMCNFEANIEDVFSVCYSAAVYLKNVAKVQKKVFALGSKGMMEELEKMGLNSFGFGIDKDPISDNQNDLLNQSLDPDVEAVLVGFDIHIGFNKIYKAASYLSRDNCHYVATNDVETRVPIGPNRILPLSGALTEAINAASERKPIVIGKPHAHLLACVLSAHPSIDIGRTIMIGDSMHTDISFACSAGIDSILVLTGSTSMADLQHHYTTREYTHTPTYVLSSFSRFGEAI